MGRYAFIVAFIAVAVSGGRLSAQSERKGAAVENAKQLDVTVRIQMRYLLDLPKDYESRPSWPLLLFLHGAGERGDDLNQVKRHGPPKLIAEGKEFPFIVVSPQCPKDQSWDAFQLTALLDELCANLRVDEKRVYVTGLSMGGFGTFALAAQTPERFAAVAPICGGGDPIWARRLAHLPTWIFHGDSDRAVPLHRSVQMLEALQQQKAPVRLTVYPETGHDSWTPTYDNDKLYNWFLEHERVDPDAQSAD